MCCERPCCDQAWSAARPSRRPRAAVQVALIDMIQGLGVHDYRAITAAVVAESGLTSYYDRTRSLLAAIAPAATVARVRMA